MLIEEYEKSMYQDLMEYDQKNTKTKTSTTNPQIPSNKELVASDQNQNSNGLKTQNNKKKNKKKQNKAKKNQ